MSLLLPEDDIPASGEIIGSPRHGLPKIPRANNQALAAINALTRILDEKLLDRNGDTSSAEFTLGTIISSLVKSSVVDADSLSAGLGSIGDLTVNSAQAQAINTWSVDASEANLEEIVATLLTSQRVVTPSGEITDLNSTNASVDILAALEASIVDLSANTVRATNTNTSNLSATNVDSDKIIAKDIIVERLSVLEGDFRTGGFTTGIVEGAFSALASGEFSPRAPITYVPDFIEYTIRIKGSINSTVMGKVEVSSGNATYTFIDKGSIVNTTFTGYGFPQHNSLDLFKIAYNATLGAVEIQGFNDFAPANDVDYEFSFQAIQLPSVV